MLVKRQKRFLDVDHKRQEIVALVAGRSQTTGRFVAAAVAVAVGYDIEPSSSCSSTMKVMSEVVAPTSPRGEIVVVVGQFMSDEVALLRGKQADKNRIAQVVGKRVTFRYECSNQKVVLVGQNCIRAGQHQVQKTNREGAENTQRGAEDFEISFCSNFRIVLPDMDMMTLFVHKEGASRCAPTKSGSRGTESPKLML